MKKTKSKAEKWSRVLGPGFLALGIWLGGSLALPAHAQVVGFGSGATITGTTNSMAVDTNGASQPIRKISLSITAPGSTVVTGFVGNVYLTLNPNSVTNGLLVGSWSGTNFTSTNITVSSFYTNAPVYTVLQAQMGTNSPSVQEIYGP